MFRIPKVVAAVTAAAVVAPCASLAAKPAPPSGAALTVSLASSAATVAYGGTATLSGSVAGTGNVGVKVSLGIDQAPFGDGFKGTGLSASTDGAGQYLFSAVAIPRNARYQVTITGKKGATSAPVTVNVKSAVSVRASSTLVKRGGRVRFSGTLKGAAVGTVMTIQRRSATGTWSRVATTRAVADTATQSKYAKTVTVRSKGTYRISAKVTTGLFLSNTSRTLIIRVR